ISPERKLEALDKVFQGRISGTVRAFLQIMLKRRREAHLPAILAVFRQTADEARKVVEAEVRSAVPVDGRQLEDLAGRFSRALGMTVRLKQVIDPDLLGGVVVKLGDRLYDGSVRSRLVRLKSRLLGAELSQEGVDR
ncbi:MAG: ATP synthase F1 subunit delta, partial [Firmicutes bacterium]|nr:ATP synthase F1 subunit delta [Bacillota bacterium]